jgi:hypothetical protein
MGGAMLTVEHLKEMKPNKIFASGLAYDEPHGLFMANTNRELRWVAQRGCIHDWAIYCHFSDKSEDWVARHGDKVSLEDNIRKLVPCNDDAFKMYRY